MLLLHANSYIVGISLLGQLAVFALLDAPGLVLPGGAFNRLLLGVSGFILVLSLGVAFLISIGMALGLATEIVLDVCLGACLGLGIAVFSGIALVSEPTWLLWLTSGFLLGASSGLLFSTARGVAAAIDVSAIGLSAIVAAAIGTLVASSALYFGIVFPNGTRLAVAMGFSFAVAFWIFATRAYYHLLHPLFLWPRVRGTWYRYHPVAWDDLCSIRFTGLDTLLAAFADLDPEGAADEVDRLLVDYPSQRGEALSAQAMLIAKDAAGIDDLSRLADVVGPLPEGEGGFLAQTGRLRDMVDEIVSFQIQLNTIDRPFLREPNALLVCKCVENFRHRVGGFHEPLRSSFRSAAERWLAMARAQHLEAEQLLVEAPVSQVFRAGDPVDRDQEAFVLRHKVLGSLEQQASARAGCPGLILYGRRRTGKSTILRNLYGYLPPGMQAIVISMQRPRAFTSLESFMSLVAEQLKDFCGELAEPLPVDDLIDFFRLLTEYDTRLKSSRRRILIAVDEYEAIDVCIGKGVFPEELLATLRESIQAHRQIVWLFAGSHMITELEHCPWSSYLVSTISLEVPLFSLAETTLLLTDPLKHSGLWERMQQSRPRFSSDFWGHEGILRVHRETGGWPHLVQLVAQSAIDELNAEGQKQLTEEILERSFDLSVSRGQMVLHELLKRECTATDEWDYLLGFRQADRQAPPSDPATRRRLQQRLLILDEGGAWQLRVPLMTRWLRQYA